MRVSGFLAVENATTSTYIHTLEDEGNGLVKLLKQRVQYGMHDSLGF